jgi:hypothetical protein
MDVMEMNARRGTRPSETKQAKWEYVRKNVEGCL